jgi:hypothetical protein
MKPIDLSLDPQLMQTLADQVQADTTAKTPAQLHALQTKRTANIKEAEQVSREQRKRDATIKMLKPDQDPLRKLRSLEVSNYFCVPHEMAKSVRAMIFRELSLSNKEYTTVKFKWGQRHYLKVKRIE